MAHLVPWTSNKQKGMLFENFTEHCLEQHGINITDVAERRLCDAFGKDTEIDRLVLDEEGEELAIVEIKSGQFNDAEQAKRLVNLAKQEGLELIFATPSGTTKNFSPSVLKVLNQERCFIIQPDNLQVATQVKPTGIHSSLPPNCPISKPEKAISISSTMKEVNFLKASRKDLKSQISMSNTQVEIANLKTILPLDLK